MTTETPTRPVLRWHGGKWILAPWIISHFPEHRVYTEVYGGAASVLMRKARSYAEVYNDLDGDVVNLFRVLRDPDTGAALREALRLTPFAREEFKTACDHVDEPIERARRMVVRSYMGFGSNASTSMKNRAAFRNGAGDRKSTERMKTGFRAVSNLSGTTPAHDWANYPECMDAMIQRLRAVVIECRPAVEILRQHDGPQTLHYVDPPYVHATRKKGQEKNYTHEMTDEDHRELANVLHGLEGMVVLSGYQSALYADLYHGWNSVSRKAMADGARERTETLWFNDRAWFNMPQGVLL